MQFSRLEQSVIIKFNAGGDTVTLYSIDKVVMREVDALVIESQESYQKRNYYRKES